MFPGIEAYYQKLANSVIHSIDEPWTVATIDVKQYLDGFVINSEFQRPTGEIESFFPTDECDVATLEIRAKFKEFGHPLWHRMTFVLREDGKFDMKWGYDPITEDLLIDGSDQDK